MKILFISDLIPIDPNENCAKALIPIIKALQEENQVDIVRPNFLLNSYIRKKHIKPNSTISVNGLEIKNLNFFTPFLFSSKNIDITNYDKIIAHMPSGILFAERLISDFKKRNSNIQIPKTAYAVHQSDIHIMRSKKYALYFKNKLKKAYTNCDEIICRAPHLKTKLLSILPDCAPKTTVKISTIPNTLIMPENEMLEKIKKLDKLRFITAANFIKRKNIHILLNAFAKFASYDFELKVVGDGPELKNLQKLSIKLNLQNKIHFTGKLTHEKVLEEMKTAQIFILPSINETLGLVYLEAAACGCLCIGTKNTGIDGIFNDNINCFLCEPTVLGVQKVLDKTFRLTNDDFKNLLTNRKLVDGFKHLDN